MTFTEKTFACALALSARLQRVVRESIGDLVSSTAHLLEFSNLPSESPAPFEPSSPRSYPRDDSFSKNL